MKRTIIHTVLSLLLLLGAVAAQAQAPTLSLTNITGVNATDWRYGTVACTSPNNITSITISMINNETVSNSSGITPTATFYSLGFNPRTVTYVFTGITPAQVQSFIAGITFRKTTEVANANSYVNISVDANPTNLPAGATITVWKDHPDGTPHYYVWVASPTIFWNTAYNEAKTYYFQGMRGYLPTITSDEENRLLTNISSQMGWSAGVRISGTITDALTFSGNLENNYADFRWACGPESGFAYYHWQSSVTSTDAGNLNNAFNQWGRPDANPLGQEPNSQAYPYELEPLSVECCMQVNHGANLTWNDYSYRQPAIGGYFIEFGGSGEAYSVNGANYPANSAYKKPNSLVSVGDSRANQWVVGYSPGNTSSAATTIKSAPLKANVMVVE